MPTTNNLFPGRSRQFVVILIIVILFVFLFYSLLNFVTAFLGAMIFYVLFRNFMNKLIHKRQWKRWTAALLIIFISFLVIVIPIFGLIYILISKVQTILTDPQAISLGYHTLVGRINDFAGREVISAATLANFLKTVAAQIPGILNSMLQLFGSVLMMYFLLFNMLINIGSLETAVFQFLPFTNDGIKTLTKELKAMTTANAIAVPLIALCQGMVASFGFWIFGLSDPLFWGIMCGCTSILPVVGAGLIWVPAGIFLLSTAEVWQGAGILIYGVVVISLIDNVFRFFFAKWFADVHPIITILGVIIGLKWFGLPGLVFGPLLISYFFLLLKIYKKEFLIEKKI